MLSQLSYTPMPQTLIYYTTILAFVKSLTAFFLQKFGRRLTEAESERRLLAAASPLCGRGGKQTLCLKARLRFLTARNAGYTGVPVLCPHWTRQSLAYRPF